MNKKGNLFSMATAITVFSFLSIIFITFYIFNYSVIYDYGIIEMQSITEDLEAGGVVIAGLSEITEQYGIAYRTMPLYLDYLWLAVYIMLISSMVTSSYLTRKQNYFGMLSFLFYGTMIILFIAGIFLEVTNWWKDNILLNLFPNLIVELPLFYWWLNNLGVNILVVVGVCILINVIDFDFATFIGRKKKERIALEEDNPLM